MVPQVEDTTLKVSAYRAGLDLTRQINHALVWFPYLAYLKANLSDRNYKRWLSYEQRRTDKRTLDSGVAQGAASSIEQLQNGGHTEGDLVQVEGLITAMEIRDDRRPPKFSTFVTLTDLASNQSITLRAHMFGLEDNGVSVGSYLRLNGWVRTGEHWLAEGETGLDIDRVNLGERSRHHWLDNVVERMKGRYPLYKDGMNMFFTLNH